MQVYKHKDKRKQKYLKYENSCTFSFFSHEIEFAELLLLDIEIEQILCRALCSFLRIMRFVSPVIPQYSKLTGLLKSFAIGDALSIPVKKLELLLCISLYIYMEQWLGRKVLLLDSTYNYWHDLY